VNGRKVSGGNLFPERLSSEVDSASNVSRALAVTTYLQSLTPPTTTTATPFIDDDHDREDIPLPLALQEKIILNQLIRSFINPSPTHVSWSRPFFILTNSEGHHKVQSELDDH